MSSKWNICTKSVGYKMLSGKNNQTVHSISSLWKVFKHIILWEGLTMDFKVTWNVTGNLKLVVNKKEKKLKYN